MRINSNKKIHKLKRDPYKTLLRMVGILAIVVVVGIGVFYLCSLAVMNDFVVKRDALDQQNAEAEVEFNAKLNAQRNQSTMGTTPENGEAVTGELPFWEKTLEDKPWRIEDEGSAGLENTGTVTLERSNLINGGLLLVNAWHSLPYDFSDTELVSVGVSSSYKIQVDNANVKLFPPAYNALSNILDAATAAGQVGYIVREGYRSNEEQTTMFNARMEKESKRFSGDALIEHTKTLVNYPGTSDYQTGMSFSLGLYSKTDPKLINLKFQRESEQGKWFTENCWKYGIALRFPTKDFPNSSWEDKSYKTGVSVELNLYRFVGPAHATAMRIMDYCLEEYIEFLVDHPHICIYEDGALRYEVVRIGAAEGSASYSLPVPNPASDYQASLDNMGGIVMAYTYQ
ncbi:MAG: D-alanyl-D-alanine carboxypeptidase family protein [Clostridia bacterium]